ncbi:MAG: hypothetical protein AAGI01_15130 [Myxococcota bacterium]
MILRPEGARFEDRALELQRAIERSRTQVAESLAALQEESDELRERAGDALGQAKAAFNPQTWVREHPWEMLGLCFAVGFYLGLRD